MDRLKCSTCGSEIVLRARTQTDVRAKITKEIEGAPNTFALDFSKDSESKIEYQLVCIGVGDHRQYLLERTMQVEEMAELVHLPSLPDALSYRGYYDRPSGFVGAYPHAVDDGDTEWQDYLGRGQIAGKEEEPDVPLPELHRKPREPKGQSGVVLSESSEARA